MPIIPQDILSKLSFNILAATGIPTDDALVISEHLVDSNLKGHDSHGVWRIPKYIQNIRNGYVKWDDRKITRENPVLLTIDGRGANGVVALTQTVKLALKKASLSTICIAGLHNVTHMGRLGDFPSRIAQQGMVGMVWTNTGSIFLAPFGSADRRLRPNPIAFAVPRRGRSPFMLDMTLSVVAGGKVEQKRVRKEPIPEGWLINQHGCYVTEGEKYDDPDVGMLPLGGLQFGHKGHGLAMMMDMIVGPLSLAGCTTMGKGGDGALVFAIDIKSFTDLETYLDEVERFVEWVNSARPLPGFERLYAPGEIEEETHRLRSETGIEIPSPTWTEIAKEAKALGVTMPQI